VYFKNVIILCTVPLGIVATKRVMPKIKLKKRRKPHSEITR
jgi:hypothetical protein